VAVQTSADRASAPDLRASTLRVHGWGIGLAVLASLHKMLLASVLVNDDFMHRTYSRQLLAGELPIKDFFDYGMGLMYAVSAAAQVVFGYRLLSEAVVIGVATAVATFLVYDVARRATDSKIVGCLAALILVVAAPRGYAYPKLIVYAVAAALWWRYVWAPDRRKAIALGLWAGIAFYWRPDHGAYVAAGVTLAIVAAHGVRIVTVQRCMQAGLAAMLLVTPYVVFASVQAGGFVAFVHSGITAVSEEHRTTGRVLPSWPVRHGRDLVGVDPAEKYAPDIGIRWTADSSADARRAVLEKYELVVVATRNEVSQQVRLSARAVRDLRAFLAEPIVEDTGGVDRGPALLPASTWTRLDRWRFQHWWLRVRILPGLAGQAPAGEGAAVLLFLLPVMGIVVALPRLRRHLPSRITVASLLCFGLFGVLVDFGLLRTPFHVRAGEAVVLPAIALGLLVAALWRMSLVKHRWGRRLTRGGLAMFVLLLGHTLIVAGQSGERVAWLAGGWTSVDRSRAAREEVGERLWSTPPVEYWRNRNPEITLQLAMYAQDCVAPTDRILVLWFAPEIYYYANRLMAGRHVFFLPALRTLPDEQRMELDKLRRFRPVLAFARVSDRSAGEAFPDMIDFLASDFEIAASVDDMGERYLILTRQDRVPVRSYGKHGWPCFL
jgi:hypothetical protein